MAGSDRPWERVIDITGNEPGGFGNTFFYLNGDNAESYLKQPRETRARQLVEQFPQSTYADDARTRMSYIVNTLAAYEVHVARYYLRRGAYVAAANRAQQAVQEFQRSPSTEEALVIMVQSYDRLGLTQLRDDADRVLQTNFPASTLRGTGFADRQRAWWQIW